MNPSPKGNRHWIMVGAGAVLLVTLGVIFLPRGSSAPRPPPRMEMVNLPPMLAPPPPPPPPPPDQKPEEKMEDKVPVVDSANAPTSPEDDAMKATDGAGDAFGLRGSKNGRGFGTGGHWGWYAGQMQAAIQDALCQNPKTRHAGLHVGVHIWLDAAGLITRVELVGSTGDPSVDDALKNQVLGGLKLPPPPEGMPRSVSLLITGKSPG